MSPGCSRPEHTELSSLTSGWGGSSLRSRPQGCASVVGANDNPERVNRDQFCSLVFTLGNLYYVACVYATGLDPEWRRCTTNHGPKWGVAFWLASLPLLARLVQSVKRYVDSGLVTHLINVRACFSIFCVVQKSRRPRTQGGKYGSGIIQYLFYYLWRSNGASWAVLRAEGQLLME